MDIRSEEYKSAFEAYIRKGIPIEQSLAEQSLVEQSLFEAKEEKTNYPLHLANPQRQRCALRTR